MITSTLEKLGLRDDEIKTFITLAETGEQTAGSLAKKAGISRPSVYGFLKKLRELGLVSESQRNGTKTFLATSEEKVRQSIDDQINDLEKGKDEFAQFFKDIKKGASAFNPTFQVFEGKTGLQQALKDMLLYRDIETKSYWPIRSMIDILGPEFFKKHNKERIERNIFTQAIWPSSQTVSTGDYPFMGQGSAFKREIRIAPKNIQFSMGYWIYGDKAAFISSRKESFGFIIESKEFVQMLSTQFDVMWSLSRKK